MEEAKPQHFSLRWNDYKTSLIEAFEALRQDDDFVDVTLGCGGRKFKAHKMLLSACSLYFRELLRGNPCQHPIIIIRETSADDLEAILEFVYNGEVNVDEKQLDSFLKAAKALQIRGLTDLETTKTTGTPAAKKRPKYSTSTASSYKVPPKRVKEERSFHDDDDDHDETDDFEPSTFLAEPIETQHQKPASKYQKPNTLKTAVESR